MSHIVHTSVHWSAKLYGCYDLGKNNTVPFRQMASRNRLFSDNKGEKLIRLSLQKELLTQVQHLSHLFKSCVHRCIHTHKNYWKLEEFSKESVK